MDTLILNKEFSFLQATGEMASLTRAYDWSQTSIGSPDEWPQSLRTTVSILLNSKFPMFLFWGPELICFYNDAFRPSLGNEGKHPWALGKKGEDVWSEIWPVIKPWIDHVLFKGEAVWKEDQLVGFFRNGRMEDIYWTFSYSPVSNESGLPGGVLVTCTETTEKIKNIEKLKESNDQLLFAIEATELGTWDYDPASNTFSANERLKEWFGLNSGDEFDLNKALDIVDERDKNRVAKAIQSALRFESEGGFDIEYAIVHPSTQKKRFVRARGKTWFDENKKAIRFNGTLQDITAHITANTEIKEKERKFRNTVQQVPVGITILKGPQFVVEMANEAYLQLVDRKEKDFVGKPLFETLPEVMDRVENLLNNVYHTGIPFFGTEYPVTIHRYGRQDTSYFNFAYKPLKEDGVVTGIVVVANEVTSLVEAKHTLAEREKQFRNLVMQSPIAMAVFRGSEMVIEMANNVMLEKLWRKKEKDVIGKPLLEVFPELQSQKFPSILQDVFKKAQPYREKEAFASIQGNDGLKSFYLDFEYSPLLNPNRTVSGIMVTVNDVTEKVEARQRIEEAEERARMTAESAGLGTYVINLDTNEWITTPRLAEVFGVPYPSHRDEYLKVLHPDDVQLREEAYKKAFETGVLEYETRVIHKDGSEHWINVKGRIYFNNEGKPVRQMGVAQEITEQKQFEAELAKQVKERTAELENKNQELQRSNANLEEFAHAASHDLKEPIRKVHFFTDRLKNLVADRLTSEELQTFSRIENATQRMSTLIDDLLMYSHVSQKTLETEEIDLNQKLRKVLDDLELDIQQKKAVIELGELPIVKGYRRQLQQLFQNLLSNALKYNKPDQPPIISISAKKVPGNEVPGLIAEDELNKDYFAIRISDNGIGFEQEDAERIFQMFQRLHGRSEYPGTGIGLAIVKKVVENHQGKIIAQSSPGEGATFTVFLPAD